MKIFSIFGRKKREEEMSDEMRQHLDELTNSHIAAGMNPDEARYLAQKKFGNVASLQERCREQRAWFALENWMRDFRLALRSLVRARGFSLAALATLALCLGPNTAILSVLYTLVYKPLPFHEPRELVAINNVSEQLGRTKHPSSVAQYLDFKAHADRFAGFGYFSATNATMGEDEDIPVRVAGMVISADLLTVVGIKAELGRFFLPDEQTPGKDRVVILSHLAWENRYHRDPTIVGREIRMDGQKYTVVGVAAYSFEELLNDVEFFRPYIVWPGQLEAQTRYVSSVRLIGRLKPDVTLEAGKAQLEVLEKTFNDTAASPQLRSAFGKSGNHISLVDARQELAEPIRAPLLLLQGGAMLVLLIGCVNVASLLLARLSAKRPELAVRHALGAGASTLLRQMLAESFVLVGVAGAVGIAAAFAILQWMNHYLPTVVRHVPPIALDRHVLGITLTAILAIILVMGIVPFVLVWRSGLRPGETPRASTGRRGRETIGALVICQVAVALMLLVCSALLIHSFARVMATNPGFDPDRIVQGRIYLPMARYQDPKDNVAIQQRILTAVKEIPGVESVGLSIDVPISATFRSTSIILRADPSFSNGSLAQVYPSTVSPEFFATMGIHLREGRGFRDDDDARTNPVMIVDETFVQRYFPGRDVVGMEVALGNLPPPAGRAWTRIIGVVSRATLSGLEGRDGWPFVYFPFNQMPSQAFSVLARSLRTDADVVGEMRSKIRAIDPKLPVYAAGSLAGSLDAMLGNRRALLWLLGLFSVLALILASVGLYGVLNYDVSQRTREIGIRGAVGATRGQIVAMILRQGLWRAGVGLGVGLVGAFFLTRLLRKMLFDISPTDPVAFGAAALLMVLVAVAASWLPARRAAKVDPVIALRAE